jgi:hypothetical protein
MTLPYVTRYRHGTLREELVKPPFRDADVIAEVARKACSGMRKSTAGLVYFADVPNREALREVISSGIPIAIGPGAQSKIRDSIVGRPVFVSGFVVFKLGVRTSGPECKREYIVYACKFCKRVLGSRAVAELISISAGEKSE